MNCIMYLHRYTSTSANTYVQYIKRICATCKLMCTRSSTQVLMLCGTCFPTNSQISRESYHLIMYSHTHHTNLYSTMATASFSTLSPNTREYRSKSTRRSWNTASTVTGSVAEMSAPNKNDGILLAPNLWNVLSLS